jgi:mono/diheme cytochrome c family protein
LGSIFAAGRALCQEISENLLLSAHGFAKPPWILEHFSQAYLRLASPAGHWHFRFWTRFLQRAPWQTQKIPLFVALEIRLPAAKTVLLVGTLSGAQLPRPLRPRLTRAVTDPHRHGQQGPPPTSLLAIVTYPEPFTKGEASMKKVLWSGIPLMVFLALVSARQARPAVLPTDETSLEEKKETLRQFVRNNPAYPEAGSKWFEINRLGCMSCHNRPGAGGGFGPDLKGAGKRYNREQLMRKVLDPRTESGMPRNFGAVLNEREFADLIAWLEKQ